MSNRPSSTPPQPSDAGKEAMARARAARAVLREQNQKKELQQKEKDLRRRAFRKNTACRTCTVYAALNVIYFFVYLAVIYPIRQQPFDQMILGGTSIIGHGVFFAASFLAACVYSLILYRRPAKAPGAVHAYIRQSCIWFTLVMALFIAAHGIYLDMLYNQYAVTDSAIFLGPSFLLTFAVLLFSLLLTAANRIYSVKRFPTAIRAILHLICVIILFSVCIQGIAHGFASASDLLVFLVIFTVLYALIAVFVFAAKGNIRREENEAEEYESMFKKTPGKAVRTNETDKPE